MNRLGLAVATLILAFSTGSSAGETVGRPKAVVELFTSQGCTSCPPADEMLSAMADAGDVVALAYHVDYWDYLGWRDTLATAENTERQQGYSRSFGNRSVYTPQAVVNGRQQMNGAKRGKVESAVRRMTGTEEGLTVDVTIAYKDDSVVIETGEADRPVEDVQIVLVYFTPATPVLIERGRNSGRRFVYFNAVSSFHTAGMWNGEKTRVALPVSELSRKGAGGCAVLVQQMGPGGLPGAILGAAIIERTASW